jgi:hypothetical protein
MALLQQVAGAAAKNGESGGGGSAAAGIGSVMRRDATTGEPYLHLPVPSQEVVETALRAVAGLLEGMRKPSS